jgi:hypothetical protein
MSMDARVTTLCD